MPNRPARAILRVNIMPAAPSAKNKPSHLKDLLLLFAVPAGIALLAAIIIYTPRLFANPTYDFIYSYCASYSCRDDYRVDSAGFVVYGGLSQADNFNNPDRRASLRYYDARTNSTKGISLEEVQKYTLDASSRSPDGYALSREERSGGFLFWGDYGHAWYLKDGLKKKSIDLSVSGPSYTTQVEFLGWVKQP